MRKAVIANITGNQLMSFENVEILMDCRTGITRSLVGNRAIILQPRACFTGASRFVKVKPGVVFLLRILCPSGEYSALFCCG